MRCWLGVAVLTLVLSSSVELRAQGRTEVAGCSGGRSTALARMSCDLARALPKAQAQTLVVMTASATSGKVDAPLELIRTLSRLLAAELGPSASLHAERVDPKSASRLARPNLDVVLVSADLTHERFAASADLVRAPSGFWRRFSGGERAVTAHAYASSVLDAELRAALPPVPLVISRVDKAAALDEPSLALACGDLNDDGSLEIVSVGRHRIQVGRLDHGKFRIEASAPWTQISEIAPRPLREPIAVASIASPGHLEVGITDRADGARLDGNLKLVERLRGRLPWPGGGCTRTLATGLASEPVACDSRQTSADTEAADAVAGIRFPRQNGPLEVFARRTQDGKLELVVAGKRIELGVPVGAQLALGELNGDGEPELITSVDTPDPLADAIIVRTLTASAELREAFRLPVPSGVRAIAVCPSEGPLLAPIVVATNDGLWVVR